VKGATPAQLARGIAGNADRTESKQLARLHGMTWKALRKKLKREQRLGR
jgi:hypothetical protein